MKTAEEIIKEYNPNDSSYLHVDDAIGAVNDYADQFKNEWVSVEDRLPEYGLKVIVARPNEYSGKTDVLIGRHHKVEKGGTTYGRMDNLQVTYKDYWSLPSITPFEDITHWQPLPSPPKTTEK